MILSAGEGVLPSKQYHLAPLISGMLNIFTKTTVGRIGVALWLEFTCQFGVYA